MMLRRDRPKACNFFNPILDLVVKALDSQSRGHLLKTMGGSKADSAVHPSEIDKMSTRDFWELSGKK